MSVTVVGSIAFDAVRTPFGSRDRMLGGAATHFALAASFFDEVRPVGPVGDDFTDEDMAVLQTRGTVTDDVERVPGGKTFFWSGEYADNLNSRETRISASPACGSGTGSSTSSSTSGPPNSRTWIARMGGGP